MDRILSSTMSTYASLHTQQFTSIRKFTRYTAAAWCAYNMAAVPIVDTMTSLSTHVLYR